MIHTVKGFGIVNKAEIDVFLELSCLFHDPVDVGSLEVDVRFYQKLLSYVPFIPDFNNIGLPSFLI